MGELFTTQSLLLSFSFPDDAIPRERIDHLRGMALELFEVLLRSEPSICRQSRPLFVRSKSLCVEVLCWVSDRASELAAEHPWAREMAESLAPVLKRHALVVNYDGRADLHDLCAFCRFHFKDLVADTAVVPDVIHGRAGLGIDGVLRVQRAGREDDYDEDSAAAGAGGVFGGGAAAVAGGSGSGSGYAKTPKISFTVSSFVRPAIISVAVTVAANSDRSVVVHGTFLPETPCIVQFNGFDLEAQPAQPGTSLFFTVPPSKWVDNGHDNAVVVRAEGVDSATFKMPFEYSLESIPQVWGVKAEHIGNGRVLLTLKGVHFEAAREGGCAVEVVGLGAANPVAASLVEPHKITVSVPLAAVSQKHVVLTLLVAGVRSMPFHRDLTAFQ
jgi:hypothetical protein